MVPPAARSARRPLDDPKRTSDRQSDLRTPLNRVVDVYEGDVPRIQSLSNGSGRGRAQHWPAYGCGSEAAAGRWSDDPGIPSGHRELGPGLSSAEPSVPI